MKEKKMGGKSRKSGKVSLKLIRQLKSGNIGKSKCVNKKIKKEDGFGLIDDEEENKKSD